MPFAKSKRTKRLWYVVGVFCRRTFVLPHERPTACSVFWQAFETTDDGYIAKILVPEGSEHVPVGTPVAVLVEEEEDVPAFAGFEAPALEDPAPAASSDEVGTRSDVGP